MKTVVLSLLLSAFVAGSAQAGTDGVPANPTQLQDAESRAALQREISGKLARIKNEGDLHAYLASARAMQTPLDLLSPGAKRRFIDSLVFTPNGLGSFTYADIRNELTLSEAYQLLALFGREATAASIAGIRIDAVEPDPTEDASRGSNAGWSGQFPNDLTWRR